MRLERLVTLSALGLLSAACSPSTPPTQPLAEAQARMRAAREIGAEQHPDARFHLKLASDQIVEAERLIAEGENTRAALLLERAGDDAAIALAAAKEKRAEAEAKDAIERADQLWKELERASKTTRERGAL